LEYDEGLYLESSNLAESLNHSENAFGLRLNRRIFTNTLIYANYEMVDYIFAARAERDSSSQTIALGIVFPEIGVLQGGLQIGVMSLQPKNPLYQKAQRPNGRGDVRITFFERLHLNVYYELQTYFSYSANNLFYDSRTFGGGAEIYLTSFLKGGASYQDGRLKYYSFIDLALQRSDHLRQQRYYLAIPFIGNMSLGFAYNVYRLSSDALNLDYTRSFWGGFITNGF
jgi:hypothetical protein